MRSFSWGRNPNGTGWLNESFSRHPLSQQVHGWWRWAFVSLGCAAGCSTPQHPGHVAGPFQASGEMLTRAGDSVEETVSGRPRLLRMFSRTNRNTPFAGKQPISPNTDVGGAIPAAPSATEWAGSLPAGSYVIPPNNTGAATPAGAMIMTPARKPAPSAGTNPVNPPTMPAPFKVDPSGLKPVTTPAPLFPPEP